MFTFFSADLTSQWRHKIGYRLFTWTEELICTSVIYTYNNHIFCVYCVEIVKKVYRNTKLKIDLILNTILHEIDGDMTSVCKKKHIAYMLYNSENLHVPCD